MMTWVVVFSMAAGSVSGGVSIGTIAGYETHAECATAAESINTQWNIRDGRRTICVPGPRK